MEPSLEEDGINFGMPVWEISFPDPGVSWEGLARFYQPCGVILVGEAGAGEAMPHVVGGGLGLGDLGKKQEKKKDEIFYHFENFFGIWLKSGCHLGGRLPS